MRITSGRSWASQFCLQKSPGQVSKASRPQRLSRCSMLCLSRNPRDKRANRVVPYRRKEARWCNTCPVAERQVFTLGRDGHMPSGRITGSAREAGAAAELTASRKEEKYASIGSESLFAPIAMEDLGPLNMSACQLFANLGSPRRQGITEKELFDSREFRCWCSATTLYCYMTFCQTARTDDWYPILYYLNF